MMMLARGNPQREVWYTVHKSIGLTILALAILRLGWRWCYPPPALPGTLASVERFAATLSHWLLYAVLIFMPASGRLSLLRRGQSSHRLVWPDHRAWDRAAKSRACQPRTGASPSGPMGDLWADNIARPRHDLAHRSPPRRRIGAHPAGAG
jgi:cytochrome b561